MFEPSMIMRDASEMYSLVTSGFMLTPRLLCTVADHVLSGEKKLVTTGSELYSGASTSMIVSQPKQSKIRKNNGYFINEFSKFKLIVCKRDDRECANFLKYQIIQIVSIFFIKRVFCL